MPGLEQCRSSQENFDLFNIAETILTNCSHRYDRLSDAELESCIEEALRIKRAVGCLLDNLSFEVTNRQH